VGSLGAITCFCLANPQGDGKLNYSYRQRYGALQEMPIFIVFSNVLHSPRAVYNNAGKIFFD
jgi:hypothetical protein